jgi:hypothetical protein
VCSLRNKLVRRRFYFFHFIIYLVCGIEID